VRVRRSWACFLLVLVLVLVRPMGASVGLPLSTVNGFGIYFETFGRLKALMERHLCS